MNTLRPSMFFLLLGASLAACSSVPDEEEAAAAAAASSSESIPSEALIARADACPSGFTPRPGANSGFAAGGQSRSFELRLPPPTFTGPRPVLFAYHGTTERASGFLRRTRLDELNARGFIVVAPDAEDNGFVWPIWDAMRPPGAASAGPNPDVELFDKLLACTAAHASVDKNRLYTTGHSAGGIFVNRLLRERSNVLAGGIASSGVFDLTGPTTPHGVLALVVWGGDNDAWGGTTPGGVNVPTFSFVEQASLASKYYASLPDVAHARCRGANVGHAWLPLNKWFADALLAFPKGTDPRTYRLPPLPPGSNVECSAEPYVLPPLPDLTCPSTARSGCTETCQLMADCAVENRTVGTALANELRGLGLTPTSCGGCTQRCQIGASNTGDARVLGCFKQHQATAQCSGGIEGADPMVRAVNACCQNGRDSRLCTQLCGAIGNNSAAKAFFPVCQTFTN